MSFANRAYRAFGKEITVQRTNRKHFLDRTPNRNIHLFGFGRGGSTWCAELLSQATSNGPFIDEPFHRPKVLFKSKSGREIFGWKEYVNPGETNPLINDYFESINNLSHLNRKLVSERGRMKPFRSSSPILFKYIDRTFLIPYLVSQYDISPVFLTRNPFSVYASRKAYGWPSGTKIPVDTAQSKSSLLHLDRIQVKYPGLYHPAKIFAIFFCEQIILFRSLSCSKLEVNYEQMVLDPNKAIKSVIDFLAIPADLNSLQFEEPSSSSRGLASGQHQLNKWRKQLDEDEKAAISETLEEYGLREFLVH